MKLIYKPSAVAFLDVLGFKKLVNDDIKPEIEHLANLLEKSPIHLDEPNKINLPKDLYKNIVPKYTQISDCIIYSSKLKVNASSKDYYGLVIVGLRSIQIAQTLLLAKYPIRGGIEIGDVHHTQKTIIGKPYQEAYRLESIDADHPRIILGNNAADHWIYKVPEHFKDTNHPIFIYYRGFYTVNIINAWYFRNDSNYSEDDYLDTYLKNFQTIIEGKILENQNNPKHVEKWIWLYDFLIHSASKQGVIINRNTFQSII